MNERKPFKILRIFQTYNSTLLQILNSLLYWKKLAALRLHSTLLVIFFCAGQTRVPGQRDLQTQRAGAPARLLANALAMVPPQ